MTIGLFYGGVSPEHEVSVISTLQAAFALRDTGRFALVPVYVAKDGLWYTGEHLLDPAAYQDVPALLAKAHRVTAEPSVGGRLALVEVGAHGLFAHPRRYQIDVAFLGFHGGPGENGAFQGLCETFDVPYTGSGVFGSALGMDKVTSKMVCRDQGIPVVPWVGLREAAWAGREAEWLDRCEADLGGYPVVVKPSRLGSSIGITLAKDRAALDRAIEEAFRYDEKIVVEYGVRGLREVNVSVLGTVNDARPSVIEEPVRTQGEAVLTFQEKYQRGGGGAGPLAGKGGAKAAPVAAPGAASGAARGAKAGGSGASGMASLDRLIPAPLSPEQTDAIQALAVRVFQTFECAGLARLDFMIEETTGRVFFNEINTIPGSFSFYLWAPSGVPFPDLAARLVDIALERHRDKNSRVRSYGVNLLSQKSLSGLKGAKGRA